MKRTPRAIGMLLAVLLILALFTGCGGTEQVSSTDKSTPAPATDAPETEESAGGTEEEAGEAAFFPLAETEELSLWQPVAPNFVNSINPPEDLVGFNYFETLTNVHVNYNYATFETAFEQFQIMAASSTLFDITFNGTMFTGGADKALEDELFISLNEYLDDELATYNSYRTSSEAYIKATTTAGGDVVGVYGLFTEGNVIEYGPVIRQDWLDELGLEVPVTYDDYYSVLTAFKTNYDAASPIFINYNGSVMGNYLSAGYEVAADILQNESNYVVIDGTVRYSPIEEGYREFITMLNKWYSEGLFDRDFMSATDGANVAEGLIAGDDVGITYTFDEKIAKLKDYSTDPDFELTVIPDAKKTADQQLHLRKDAGWIGTDAAISTTCENPSLAARWLDYWFSDAGHDLWNYGIEDETYTRNADGSIELGDLILNNPDELTISAALYKYACQNGPFLMETTRAYYYVPKECSEIWGQADNSYFYSVNAMTLTSDESTEYNGIYADIGTYVSESLLAFITGEKELSEWDAYVAQVQSMDIARCIEIRQAAYERYAGI